MVEKKGMLLQGSRVSFVVVQERGKSSERSCSYVLLALPESM